MHQITYRIPKIFRGYTPNGRRLAAPPQIPVPDWESEKAATLIDIENYIARDRQQQRNCKQRYIVNNVSLM